MMNGHHHHHQHLDDERGKAFFFYVFSLLIVIYIPRVNWQQHGEDKWQTGRTYDDRGSRRFSSRDLGMFFYLIFFFSLLIIYDWTTCTGEEPRRWLRTAKRPPPPSRQSVPTTSTHPNTQNSYLDVSNVHRDTGSNSGKARDASTSRALGMFFSPFFFVFY
jgi:hypothetical protein